jgi:uncharacterized protein (TIGR02231 family)
MTITEVDSVVLSVTVYQGRAMITREAKARLDAGDHTLVFPGLPADLERDSLQVKGAGEAVLGECVFETEYLDEDVDGKRRPLLAERLLLSDEAEELNLHVSRLAAEKTFLDRISTLLTTPPTGGPPPGTATPGPLTVLDVGTWSGITEFHRSKHTELDSLRLAAERKLRGLSEKIENLDARLEDLGASGRRSREVVKVGIRKKTAGDLTLRLSYLLSGPSWRPVYNLRASGDSDVLALEYDAYISQATGEDWSGVELRLSTARVNVSGVIPELRPWRLEFRRPRPAVLRSALAKESAKAVLPETADYASGAAPSVPYEEEDAAELDFERDDAEIRDSGASVVFTVAGGGSVSGDNRDTRVGLARREFPAVFLHRSVPKLAEFAYLTARFKNEADFPILPGAVNIFFDGSFVSGSAFDLILPGQETEVSLGVDEGVKVEYRFLKRFRKGEGLVNKRVSEQFEHQIRVTNNRSRPADLSVADQFPLTSDKDLVVKALQPLTRDHPREVVLDDESRITWTFSLKPGEKRELPLAYLVEYPADRTVEGI